jgi:predicted nucleotidyltransferase
MVMARELTQTLRARSAERRAKAEVRAERLRAQLPKAASILIAHYQASRVVLFGSLANGTHDEHSDVDLAVEGLPSAGYFHALADLMALFGGPVDLKASKTNPGAPIHYFASRLGVRHKFLVVGDLIEAGTAGDVRVLDASAFLAALPV